LEGLVAENEFLVTQGLGLRNRRPPRWAEYVQTRSERAEIVFREASLLEDLPKGAGGQRTGVHCHVGLAAIRMAQDFVAPALSYLDEPGAE